MLVKEVPQKKIQFSKIRVRLFRKEIPLLIICFYFLFIHIYVYIYIYVYFLTSLHLVMG